MFVVETLVALYSIAAKQAIVDVAPKQRTKATAPRLMDLRIADVQVELKPMID